jgi:mono/diheme cytochrome c family protein
MRKFIHGVMSALMVLSVSGCRQDMQNQPKMLPQRSSALFADGRSVRPQVYGTVARSQGDAAGYFRTGLLDGKEADRMPFPVTAEVLARGQERFNTYCSPCHSRIGNGRGMITQRGFHLAGDFHAERLLLAPVGHFFNVMTNGYGAMPNYAAELAPQDRWAVVAYIRALQLSQDAKPTDVPPGKTIERMQDITARQGLPEGFAGRWNSTSAMIAASQAPAPLPQPVAPVVAAAPPATKIASAAAPAVAKPQSTSVSTGPPPTGDAAAGERIYMQNCQACHQATRTGLPPMIPSLLGIVTRVGPEHIHDVVTSGIPTGRPPMPAFTQLSDHDIENLIAYLRTGK